MLPCTVRRFASKLPRLISVTFPPIKPIIKSLPLRLRLSRFRCKYEAPMLSKMTSTPVIEQLQVKILEPMQSGYEMEHERIKITVETVLLK